MGVSGELKDGLQRGIEAAVAPKLLARAELALQKSQLQEAIRSRNACTLRSVLARGCSKHHAKLFQRAQMTLEAAEAQITPALRLRGETAERLTEAGTAI